MADRRKKSEYYAFPAIFEVDHNDDDRICVEFPDLPNCFSDAKTIAEAVKNATEALENVLYWMEKDGNPIPKPSDIQAVECSIEQFKSLIVADMASARRAWNERSISRTVTMPAWLDELARVKKINVSKEVQDAIKAALGISANTRSAGPRTAA